MDFNLSPPFAISQSQEGVSLLFQGTASTTIWVTNSSDGIHWTGPFLTPRKTSSSPAAAFLNNRLYMVYGSTFDLGTMSIMNNGSPATWGDYRRFPGDIMSDASPSLVAWKGGLILVWKGKKTNTLWTYSSPDGTSWGTFEQLPPAITTSHSPSTFVWNEVLYIVFKSSADNAIFIFSSKIGGAFQFGGLQQLPPAITTSKAPATVVWNDAPYIVFRSSSDNSIFYATLKAKVWELFRLPPALTTKDAPTAAVINKRLFVIFKSAVDTTIFAASTADGTNWDSLVHLPDVITVGGGNPPDPTE